MMDVQNPSTEAGAVAVGGRPAHSTAPADRQLDQIYSRVRLRLMPLLLIAQVLAYLDRVNIGTAKLQMAVDLHFSNAVYGLGAGIFFVGYFIAEVPSNMLLHRLGARAWIARIMVSWGILSAATMFIHSTQAFYVQRFLLGLAEAGFFPGVVLYLTYWFPAHRRGSMTTLFMSATAVSGIVGGPLSGWIMVAFNGLHGLEGWRWMFLLEAGPAIALGVVIFFRLPDRPRDVQWLGAEDKALLQRDIDTYVPSQGSTRGNAALRAVLNATTLFFSAVYFLLLAGLYGVSFWLPSLIRQTGVHDTLTISWLSAIPYAVAVLTMNLVARRADRTRTWSAHVGISALVAGAGFLMSVVAFHSPAVALGGLTVASAGILSALPLFWSLPTERMQGATAAAGIALINSIGNLSGFVSPFAIGWLTDMTQRSSSGVSMLAVGAIIAGLLTLGYRRREQQAH